jgi:hypothetical protein
MSAGEALLECADALLEGTRPATGTTRSRAAALLTRQAMEAVLSELWGRRSPSVTLCSTKSQILCLRDAGLDPATLADIRHTWAELSSACHFHPYEVGPSDSEIRTLLASVRRLREVMRAQAGEAIG